MEGGGGGESGIEGAPRGNGCRGRQTGRPAYIVVVAAHHRLVALDLEVIAMKESVGGKTEAKAAPKGRGKQRKQSRTLHVGKQYLLMRLTLTRAEESERVSSECDEQLEARRRRPRPLPYFLGFEASPLAAFFCPRLVPAPAALAAPAGFLRLGSWPPPLSLRPDTLARCMGLAPCCAFFRPLAAAATMAWGAATIGAATAAGAGAGAGGGREWGGGSTL